MIYVTVETSKKPKLLRTLTSETFMMWVIVVNATTLFLDAFPKVHETTGGNLLWVDRLCILVFVLEAGAKLRALGRSYFAKGWNRFDFAITLLSLPALIPFLPMQATMWVSVLRLGRALRFLRLLKFVPNSAHIIQGTQRALKASIGVFLALFFLNMTLSLVATIMFSSASEEDFGNPLKSSYSLLKMFTIEGWYEIPEKAAGENPGSWVGPALRAYAVLTVLVGGVLGMGLANAVFIDEMTSDNNDDLRNKLEEMQKTLKEIKNLADKKGEP